ncbi:MAG TPA: hypothetical protein VFM81_08800 [Actinomycetota bacterium]|nr:hypothetical protein [Actinomycetota bacterium]
MTARWVAVTGTIRAVAEIDPAVAERVFGTTETVALGGWPGATNGRAWGSFARFAADVASGTVPDDVRVVMYDPERWERTPIEERLDPIGSIEAFGRLARSKGYDVIVTPHANLVEVPGSPHAPGDDESREDAYLRSGIIEAAAANADAVETQAQRMQRDPRAYRAFVADTARVARSVNPKVEVLSGLSTHPGYPATAEMLTDAWRSVRDVVDGHYLSLAKLRLVEVATAFLARYTTTIPACD